MRFTDSLPPLDVLPEAARKVAAELVDLRVRVVACASEGIELNPNANVQGTAADPDRIATLADAALLALAARDDKLGEPVGTPNADRLKQARADQAIRAKALDEATLVVEAEFVQAIGDHLDEAHTAIAATITTSTAAYHAAIDDLEAARRRHLDTIEVARWIDAAATARPMDTVSFGVQYEAPIQLDRLTQRTAGQILAAFRAEAEG